MIGARENEFRRSIESGDAVLGARAATYSPTVVELLGMEGFEWAWLDFEHAGPSPWDSRIMEELSRAGSLAEIEPLVRVPGDPSLIRKVLDAGIRTLLIPRVDSVEEVREAVAAARFVHDGRPGERGYAGWRSSGYGTVDDYVEVADDAVCLGVMIEKRGALEDLEEILQVPELGFVFVGRSDLSVQLGHPDDREAPAVRDAVERIERAAASADVPVGGIAHDPDDAATLLDRGYRIVRIGGELEAARETLRDRLERVDEAR